MSRLTERFISKVREDSNGCWIWVGSLDSRGLYGQFSYPTGTGRMTGAHRASHLMFVGPIPGGYWVDHLCRVTRCVRPDHLEAVTPGENTHRGKRGLHVGGTCLRGGHRITTEADVYVDTLGRRTCLHCWRATARRGYAKRVTSPPPNN